MCSTIRCNASLLICQLSVWRCVLGIYVSREGGIGSWFFLSFRVFEKMGEVFYGCLVYVFLFFGIALSINLP